jgi:hypothetical protein|tara:strand:- start:2714 stop:3748 length:1035 start_codon:yes stop_codon:yes gene_type:complete
MSSGLVQLIAIGAQDEHIIGEPEISFFTSTFKRHSNFSQSLEKQTIQGAVRGNSMSSIRFERNGDLLGYTYFTIDNNTQAVDIQDWGKIIDKVEILIGGQVIDSQDHDFTEKIAIDTFAQNVSKGSNGTHPGASARSYFYPLRFFFCEGPQSAIPLVALQYHAVELRIYWGPDAGNYNVEAYTNYYYLDNEERGIMTSRTHDILITQVQKSIPSSEKVQELTFNHPIKYIACSNTNSESTLTAIDNKIKLSINGTDINSYKWAKPHFVDITSYYHTNFVTSPDFFLHCFCLNTSSLQPTGSLNFSRLDSVKIHSQNKDIIDSIYGVNYNILRVNNGMAGLMYAN